MSLTIQGPVDALAVPVSAIRSGQGGGATVMVVDGTTEREVAVTTGIVAGGWVEVSASIHVRREALTTQMEVGDLHRRPVAAGRCS